MAVHKNTAPAIKVMFLKNKMIISVYNVMLSKKQDTKVHHYYICKNDPYISINLKHSEMKFNSGCF